MLLTANAQGIGYTRHGEPLLFVHSDPSGADSEATYEPFPGLRKATFQTSDGVVTVNIPDDMSVGDLVSGTTVILASSANDGHPGQHEQLLSKYQVTPADAVAVLHSQLPDSFLQGSNRVTLSAAPDSPETLGAFLSGPSTARRASTA
jgi:hypothetical protein